MPNQPNIIPGGGRQPEVNDGPARCCRDCERAAAGPDDYLCPRCRQSQLKDARRRALRRQTIPALVGLCQNGVTAPSGKTVQITGAYPLGTWSKDDLVAAIMSAEFADAEAL
jgi:hypothetical protein